MIDKLRIVKQRFDEVSDLIIQPDVITDQKRYVKLNKEYKDLKKIVDKGEAYTGALSNIEEANEISWYIKMKKKITNIHFRHSHKHFQDDE